MTRTSAKFNVGHPLLFPLWAVVSFCAAAQPGVAHSRPSGVQITARSEPDCVDFRTPAQLPAGESFTTAITRGLEFRLRAEDRAWTITVGPVGTRQDYLWVVSPPFRTAPHRQIGAGYGMTGPQSAQKSSRSFRFVTTPDEYDAAVQLVNIATRDAGADVTAQEIERQGKGTLDLWITGFGATAAGDALAWITVRGRACQPSTEKR